METDEILAEEEQPTPSSGEKQTTSEGREADKTPEGGETIPYLRFKEVIDEKNKVKEDLDALRQDIEILKQQQPKPEEPEPKDWKEVEGRAVQKAISEMERKLKESEEADYKQEQKIERSFEQLQSIGQEVTPEIKKAVLTEMIKTGDDDVLGTYLKVKERAIKTEKTEKLKKEGFVPSSERDSSAGNTGLSYKELRSKSLDEIVEAASRAKK